jgi:dTDP-4-amino-4,6-dideoxygalactose transaminase
MNMNDMKTIQLFKVHVPLSVDVPLLEVLHSGYIGQGVKVDKFEAALAERIDNKNVVTLNTGTAGLRLALHIIGIRKNDEVISTPMTCLATNTPIVESGAKIVWADVNRSTGNIDPESIEAKITERTRAIVCVDWGGYPCDLDGIKALAVKNDISVIEDAAHAFGAEYKNHKVGSISDFTMFSFQAIKHITTVDGGCLSFLLGENCKRAKLLRWYGLDRDYSKELRCEQNVSEAGYKYHMNDVAAVIGLEQLNYIDDILMRHRDNAMFYTSAIDGLRLERIDLPDYEDDRLSSYWLYPLIVDERESFIEFMTEKKIMVSRVHARNDLNDCFKEFKLGIYDLPGVDLFDEHQINIPVGWWVDDSDRERIVEALEEFDNA